MRCGVQMGTALRFHIFFPILLITATSVIDAVWRNQSIDFKQTPLPLTCLPLKHPL